MKSIYTVLCIALLGFSQVSQAEVAVVVNVNNNAAITDSEISRLFLGKLKKYASGESATPVNAKVGSATRNEFEQKVIKKSASQVKAYWSKRMFSGKGKPPTEKGSDADVLAFVAGDTGAIGYVDAASVDASVKVVKTF